MASPARPNRRDRELESTQRLGALGLLRKALTEQREDWDMEELLDVIHWQRQILAVICGVAWGAIPLTGFWAFVGFLTVNLIVVLSWWRAQRIDEDEYGGMQALMTEGLPPAVGLFLVAWIFTYTITDSLRQK